MTAALFYPIKRYSCFDIYRAAVAEGVNNILEELWWKAFLFNGAGLGDIHRENNKLLALFVICFPII